MMARPPPARPHIGIIPSSQFSSYATVDWAEDDAWDSASDSESTPASKFTSSNSSRRPASSTSAPKPVPQQARRTSTSTLAFSYTHVQAPSPSSYPPRPELQPSQSSKADWTIIGKHAEQGDPVEAVVADGEKEDGQERDDPVEDMVVGEMEAEPSDQNTSSRKWSRKETVRDDAEEIVRDPLRRVRRRRSRSPTKSQSPTQGRTDSAQIIRALSIRTNRRHKFVDCLMAEDVNIGELRKLAWNGIPNDLRPIAWQLLLGYLPLPAPLRSSTLSRKREEYASLVEFAFARGREGLDQQIWHQIEIDVPRTRPGVRLWMHAATQRCIERILYVWAIRHPASGYVQGINDLVTPFVQVFMSAYIDSDPEEFDPALFPPTVLNAIEADSFWCLSRLLDGIQDNYISAQPGIQKSVKRMADLVARIDAPLAAHLQSQSVEFMQFAFRWMNCLLMREISVQNTIRMWDTYLAEGPDAFSQFHLYVCSAFLIHWSKKLQDMDFQGIIMFLQSLPTQDWDDHEIEMLLSQAFVFNSTWHNAQSHFSGT